MWNVSPRQMHNIQSRTPIASRFSGIPAGHRNGSARIPPGRARRARSLRRGARARTAFQGAVAELPSWYSSCRWEDWPLYILYAERGKIGYLNEVVAVYRNHGRGLWSGLDPIAQLEAVIQFLLKMDERLGYRYPLPIEASISKYRDRLGAARGGEHSMRTGVPVGSR